MSISFSLFSPRPEVVRVYINGTTRKKLYLKEGKNGNISWGSPTTDTYTKKKGSSYYAKERKDLEAINFVMEMYGINWKTPFQVVLDHVNGVKKLTVTESE